MQIEPTGREQGVKRGAAEGGLRGRDKGARIFGGERNDPCPVCNLGRNAHQCRESPFANTVLGERQCQGGCESGAVLRLLKALFCGKPMPLLRHRRRVASLSLALLGLGGGALSSGHGEVTEAGEYELKATLALNFGRYAEFADESIGRERGLRLGVAGSRRICDAFERVATGDTVRIKGWPVELVRLEDPADMDRCDIVFLTRPFASKEAWRERIAASRAMVLGEDDELLEAGGDAIFQISVDRRMVFDVRRPQADVKPFSFRSQLLTRARTVYQAGRGDQP